MKYEPYCAEHHLKLVWGHCDKCRDANGNTFPLDMQSRYLKAKEESHNGQQNNQDPQR
jgi:hypothetical protein